MKFDYNGHINAQLSDFIWPNNLSLGETLYRLWLIGDYELSMRHVNKLLQFCLIEWDSYYMIATISESGLELLDYLTQP